MHTRLWITKQERLLLMSLKDVYSVVQLDLVHVHYISVCIFNIIDGICAALLVFFFYLQCCLDKVKDKMWTCWF